MVKYEMNCKRVGLFFLIWPLLTYAFIIISFIIDWHINAVQIILALAISIFAVNKDLKLKPSFINTFVILFLAALTILFSINIYDPSCDGQVYHGATIKILAEGWNPFYNPILNPTQLPYNIEPEIAIWSSHYGKGFEIVQASIVNLTQKLEAGKAFNLWLSISLFCLSYDFLSHGVKVSKKSARLLFSVLIMSNPVVISQIFTYYFDYSSYIFICLGIILYYNVITGNGLRDKFSLYLICFYIPAIKFNIAFYFIIILIFSVWFIYILYRKFSSSIFLISAAVAIGGFFIGGYNPYVTNMIYKNNMFYPLLGEESLDIMTDNTPLLLKGENRFQQVNISLISNPNNDFDLQSIENPLGVSSISLKHSGLWDTRVGGFGIFFMESFLVLLIVFFSLKKNRTWCCYLSSIIFLYLSLFFLPSGFWARYVAYYYVSVVILALYIFKYYSHKIQYILGLFGSLLLLINGFITLPETSYLVSAQRLKTDYLISKIKKTSISPIKINSKSVTLLDKLDATGKVILFNQPFEEGEASEMVKVYPFPEISSFPELYKTYDGSWLIKKLGYKSIVFLSTDLEENE